jgi:hypothetical protein
MDLFFPGLDRPGDARHFALACISIGVLDRRKADFAVKDWILDSRAFKTLEMFGRFPDPPEVYADKIKRWSRCGNLLAAVTQDYMCEPMMLKKQDFQSSTISE